MIEVYISDNSIWCRRTRNYLSKKGVAFRTIDATSDKRRITALTGQDSLPVTVIGDTAVIGFDRQAIDTALENIR